MLYFWLVTLVHIAKCLIFFEIAFIILIWYNTISKIGNLPILRLTQESYFDMILSTFKLIFRSFYVLNYCGKIWSFYNRIYIIESISFESIKNFKGLNFLDIYFRICPLWTVDHREIENIFFCFEFILRVNLHKILKPHFWSTG